MVGLPSLEAYNSVSDITEEKTKFELYTANFEEFPFVDFKNEIKEILDISNSSQEHIQH